MKFSATVPCAVELKNIVSLKMKTGVINLVRNMKSIIATVVVSSVIVTALMATPVYAQGAVGKATRKPAQAVSIAAEDLRKPELLKSSEPIQLGDGFSATKNLNTIDVRIPGAYMDTLKSSAVASLPIQLAAAAFMKVAKVEGKTVDAVLEKSCLGSKEGKTGSGETTTFHTFKLANGHKYKIFVYLNDFDGLMAIISATR